MIPVLDTNLCIVLYLLHSWYIMINCVTTIYSGNVHSQNFKANILFYIGICLQWSLEYLSLSNTMQLHLCLWNKIQQCTLVNWLLVCEKNRNLLNSAMIEAIIRGFLLKKGSKKLCFSWEMPINFKCHLSFSCPKMSVIQAPSHSVLNWR